MGLRENQPPSRASCSPSKHRTMITSNQTHATAWLLPQVVTEPLMVLWSKATVLQATVRRPVACVRKIVCELPVVVTGRHDGVWSKEAPVQGAPADCPEAH